MVMAGRRIIRLTLFASLDTAPESQAPKIKINREYSHEPGRRGRGSLSGFVFTFSREEPPVCNVAKTKYGPKRTIKGKPKSANWIFNVS